jgi:hypothetical protein
VTNRTESVTTEYLQETFQSLNNKHSFVTVVRRSLEVRGDNNNT